MKGTHMVTRAIAALFAVVFMMTVTGCGESRTASEARQKQELEVYKAQTDAWGAEIIAWIPAEEIDLLTPFYAGGQSTRDDSVKWPMYYIWEREVVLFGDGPRSPEQLADDLDPWLRSQGWIRNKRGELPPGPRFFFREYVREGYLLALNINTIPPPYAQSVAFTIVSPDTHTRKPKAST